jgi:hypothetical protein
VPPTSKEVRWIAAGALAACASGCHPAASASRAPAPASQPPVAWSYEVHASDPPGARLAIEATFAPTTADSFGTDDDVAPFVRSVQFAKGDRWLTASEQGGSWTADCLSTGCTIRYEVALGEAAAVVHGVDTALLAGGLLVAPPSSWLLRPSTFEDGDARVRFRVTGARFASAMAQSNGAFEASVADIEAAGFAVFGPLLERTVQRGGARVDLAIAPEGLSMSPADVQAWVAQAVAGIARYYGAFPVARTFVVLVPGTSSHTEGETLGDGGGSVVIRVGRGLTAAAAQDDWVVTHELLHVTLPSLGRDEAWLSEGIATYVEPIVSARAGIVSETRFWSDLVQGLPQGLPEPGDEGLERTHTWGRTYWGGALFCLVADIRIRERTGGARSFDDALRGIVATGANVASHWPIERFLTEGDRAVGAPVLREIYEELALAPGHVDLPRLWRRLGVQVGRGGTVTFDDHAELAALRRAIARPQLGD